MKNFCRIFFIPVFSLILFTGCATFQPSFYEKSSYNIDLSKYQKEGLFITTGDYYSKYEPLSILTVSCYNGYINKQSAQKNQAEIQKNYDPIYSGGSSFKIKDFDYKDCLISDLLDYIFESAKEIGAKGIIKLEIKPISQRSPDSGQNQDGFLVTGLAIKY